MKIKELMNNKTALEKTYNLYIKRKLIVKSISDLSKAHIAKSDINMEFVAFLLEGNKFFDWCVVGLYYSVYHAALALLSKSGFSSKDHNATLCFLIENFSEISKEEIELIENLQISKEDVEFYSGLKEERQKASYSTSLLFNKEKVQDLREMTIALINKIKLIIEFGANKIKEKSLQSIFKLKK